MDVGITFLLAPDDSNETIARRVAEQISADIPAECTAGVAANVRLLAQHVAVMRGENA